MNKFNNKLIALFLSSFKKENRILWSIIAFIISIAFNIYQFQDGVILSNNINELKRINDERFLNEKDLYRKNYELVSIVEEIAAYYKKHNIKSSNFDQNKLFQEAERLKGQPIINNISECNGRFPEPRISGKCDPSRYVCEWLVDGDEQKIQNGQYAAKILTDGSFVIIQRCGKFIFVRERYDGYHPTTEELIKYRVPSALKDKYTFIPISQSLWVFSEAN